MSASAEGERCAFVLLNAEQSVFQNESSPAGGSGGGGDGDGAPHVRDSLKGSLPSASIQIAALFSVGCGYQAG